MMILKKIVAATLLLWVLLLVGAALIAQNAKPVEKESPSGRELRLLRQLAEVTLAGKYYDEALGHYQTLLEDKFDQPELWVGYVDAASSAKDIDDGKKKLVLRIHERIIAGGKKRQPGHTTFLSRLGWVLWKMKEEEKSVAILKRAVATNPKETAVRRELLGALGAAGMLKEVLEMYDGLPELTIEDRHQRAWVLFWLERYEAAERECRTIIQQKIDSVDAWELLAHIKARSGKFREAAEIYKQLLKQERSAQGKKPD